ncbi:MAG: hypothetical protein K9J37_19660 [Saprospiraceae bacterium]|nr:hypothetical protein [Saprospiraceae bacterium]MCF8252143.1 hypothetical protein [Saprospiraceae bacterium]MCF8282448.1 hypothetical protein [Bacteroidales bacterium]MCF8313812.1 hypothetical protein [Saprospiraceae bacterium]MCF8442518.1 hypothetical protein [Saprospiraceae bacterium]
MCENNCINKTRTLTLPSGTTSGKVQQQFEFINTGSIVYNNLELWENGTNGTLVCCQNIGTTKFGLRVDNGVLVISAPHNNRFITVKMPTNTNRRPEFEIQKDSVGDYYFIGIDDIRGNFSQCYFKFKLNGNSKNGVNINFQSNELIVEGGYND